MLIAMIIMISGLLLDQGTKMLIRLTMEKGNTITLIPKLLEINYIENSGAAFGILDGEIWFFAIITIAVLIIMGYLFTKTDFKKRKIYTFAIPMIIAGTLGNALDRFIRGSVTDFIHHPNKILEIFAIYNIADVLLIFGVILLLIEVLFLADKRKKLALEKSDSDD